MMSDLLATLAEDIEDTVLDLALICLAFQHKELRITRLDFEAIVAKHGPLHLASSIDDNEIVIILHNAQHQHISEVAN